MTRAGVNLPTPAEARPSSTAPRLPGTPQGDTLAPGGVALNLTPGQRHAIRRLAHGWEAGW